MVHEIITRIILIMWLYDVFMDDGTHSLTIMGTLRTLIQNAKT